eukprot:scaffold663423_cov57-Prasinocladus_malaysianus.AAC.1
MMLLQGFNQDSNQCIICSPSRIKSRGGRHACTTTSQSLLLLLEMCIKTKWILALQVLPLPSAALNEDWAQKTHTSLIKRFGESLEKAGVSYTFDLVKEYGPKSYAAIGHCICGAADDMEASVIIVAHDDDPSKPASSGSVSRFVANYCRLPVILLNRRQLEHMAQAPL